MKNIDHLLRPRSRGTAAPERHQGGAASRRRKGDWGRERGTIFRFNGGKRGTGKVAGFGKGE
jgi:hypothetical protein